MIRTFLLSSLIVSLSPLMATGQSSADQKARRVSASKATVTKPEVTLASLMTVEKTIQEMYTYTLSCTVAVGRKGGSAGASGVIVSKDGLVLTCAHVIRSTGDVVTVYLSDGRKVRGKALGSNSGADAAMIQILDKGEYPFAKVRASSELKKDEWCIMMGHPQSMQKKRPAPLRIGRFLDLNRSRRGYVRTSCTMMGGDSGGPLFDLEGRVVGINSNIGVSITQNYHVPTTAFLDDWERLRKGERWGARRGSRNADRVILGMNIQKTAEGKLRISRVQRYASAEAAGIKLDDVLIELEGKPIEDPKAVNKWLEGKKAGDKLAMTLRRGEEKFEVKVRMLSARQISAAARRNRGSRGSRRGNRRTGRNSSRASSRWVGTGPGNPFRKEGRDVFHGSVLSGMREVLDEVVKKTSRSVVPVYVGNTQVAMATAVRKNGYLLTKASEVVGQKALVQIDGKRLAARVVKKFADHDLVMIKVEADVPVVVLGSSRKGPAVGTLVTGAGPDGQALELGVVSVLTRPVDSRRPHLGVSFETRSTGLRVRTIENGSAAAKMGLVAGDEVLELNGKRFETVAKFIAALRKVPAGEPIQVGIDQEGALLVLEGKVGTKFVDDRVGRLHLAGGQLSKRRAGFAIAIQTDLTLDPGQCGSPLVGLDGKVLGINISRSRRTASYAVPASVLRKLVGQKRREDI